MFDCYTEPVVIALRGSYQVLAEREDIRWRDGTEVGIYRVIALGKPDVRFLRAVRGSDTLWRVIDLREVDKHFAQDWLRAAHQDRNGIVLYTLRCTFESAKAFVRWAEAADPAPRIAHAPLPALRAA